MHTMKRGGTCGKKDGHKGRCIGKEAYVKARKASSDWYYEHKVEKREERAAYMRNYNRTRHARVIALYGDCCADCGSTDRLEIDHIYGGGLVHLKEMFNGQQGSFYVWLLENHPAGFQVLCRSCNVGKENRARAKRGRTQ